MTHLTTIALSKIDFNLTSARQRDRVSLLDEGGVSLSKVVVNQNGSNSTIFRSSNEFFYGVPMEKEVEATETSELPEETEETESTD